MTPVPPNRAVRNAFQLLELLAGSPDGLPLGRLAAGTGLPKTTVHRLLGTLEDLDVVCRDEVTARFHLSATGQRYGGCATRFSAPIRSHDGVPLAVLTLRTRGPGEGERGGEWGDETAHRLRRLVADLAVAVSRKIGA